MVAKVIRLNESKKQLQRLEDVFTSQQAAFRENPMPSLKERIANLKKLRQVLMDRTDDIVAACNADFSSRSDSETKLADVMPVIHGIDYSIKNLAQWMAPEKRKVGPLFMPASARVEYQPLGVVGIITPWNYPIFLSMGPLIAALSAGNRVMIKMSEFTPETSDLIDKLMSDTFSEDHVCVIQGDAEVGAQFSSTPWNHLFFTGSTAVGKHVMRAAAEHLTPVTLELGGKSPVLLSDNVNMDQAIKPIVFGKTFNGGQTCVAPDYVLCPEHRVDHFVSCFQEQFAKMYPTLKHNSDFCSIINDRQRQRLHMYLDDAEKKGATVVECNPADEDFSEGTRKMPVYLVLDSTEDMLIRQEEIFGPILLVQASSSLEDAIEFVNSRPRPLALYFFGNDNKEERQVLDQTHAGGVCINDTLSQTPQEDLHFGGVGESGMGSYHGKEGFLTFSHAKPILSKKLLNSTAFAYPPYGRGIHKAIFSMFLR